jgi:hypothetical protein
VSTPEKEQSKQSNQWVCSDILDNLDICDNLDISDISDIIYTLHPWYNIYNICIRAILSPSKTP